MPTKPVILAIDDDQQTLALLSSILNAEGYEVRPADSGELGLSAASVIKPDIVLLDVNMSGIDGIEVCKRLNSNEELQHIPVILISGTGELKQRIAGLKCGAVDYILKPFNREELLARIHLHLEISQARSTLKNQASDLKLSNELLKHESELRQVMIDSLPCLAVILKKHTREIMFANKAAVESGAIIGKTCYESIAHRNSPCPFCLASELWTSDTPKNIEVEYNGKYYKGIWVPYSEALYVHYIFDITQEKKNQELLRINEERFKMIATSTPDHIIMQDKDLRYLWVINPQLGLTVDEMIGRTDIELLPGPDGENLTKIKKNVLDSGEPKYFDLSLPSKKGDKEYFEGTYVPSFDSTNKINGILGYFKNVTERKAIEKENLLLLDTIKSSLNEIYIFDSKTLLFKYVNNGALKNLGYSVDEIKKMTPLDLKPEYTFESFQKLIKPLLCNEKQFQLFETVHQRRDKTLYPVEVRLQLFNYHDESVFLAVIVDITERKKNEHELALYRDHLEELITKKTEELRLSNEKLFQSEKLAILGKLAGMIAHEVKNPLAVMKYAIHYLTTSKSVISPEKIKEYLDIINRNITISSGIINNVLDFAKKRTISLSNNRLSQTIDEALITFTIPDNINVEKLFRIDPEISYDAAQILQVFHNIIINSIQAMKQGGWIKIILDEYTQNAVTASKYIAITIEDSGEGITEENIPKVFEPLFSTKTSGIGFGMSIVKDILDKHGWKINLESVKDKGTKITILIPAQ